MRKYNLFLFLILVNTNLYAQDWRDEMIKQNRNYFEIQRKASNYFNLDSKSINLKKQHALKTNKPEEDEGESGYKIYKRWEEFWKTRINADGSFPAPDVVVNEMNAWRKKHVNSVQSSGNWSPMGPFTVGAGNGWSPGIGRINGVAVNPLNPNVIYACAPAGGIWKSNTGGSNFVTTTDHLPAIGFTSIAVDHVDTNIVYAASGDGDAGDTYSLGLLKSIDGGATWNTTGLNWITINARLCHRVLIDPVNRNVIFVCTNNGIYRSTDAAATFTLVHQGNIYDLEFNPGNNNEMYAVGASQFYKSTNNGQSFINITNGLPAPTAANRFSIAVTPANNNYIYLIAGAASNSGFLGLWRSTDAGNSFKLMSNTPNVMGWDISGTDAGGQSWYTLTIAADPLNAEHILTGGVNVWESFDGGNNFNINAHWVINSQSYVHADIHFLDYINGTLYTGTDGGLFKWNQSALNWTDLSEGLQVSQFYRIGASATDPNFVLAGAQDNGSIRLINFISDQWLGADGFEQAINPINNNIIYGEAQYGGIYRSTDKGLSSSYIAGGIAGNSDWDTPFLLNNVGHLFVGYEDIWRSTNNGNTFLNITNAGLGVLKYMDISEADQNVIYATNGQSVYKVTINTGVVVNITNGLPGTKSYIAVSDVNANCVYVTIAGFTAGDKVYRTNDGGLTWKNISGNLPNIPTNTVIEDTTALQGVYVGTESGVFYTNNLLGQWQLFDNGLPNTIVREFEFNYAANKIRAATYGRGIWESTLYQQSKPAAAFTQNKKNICEGQTIVYTDISTEAPTARTWYFQGGNPTTANTKQVTVYYPSAGMYDVTLTVSNSNGTDSITKSLTTKVETQFQSAPFVEGFENPLPQGWQIENVANIETTWDYANAGAYGASTKSLKATNFNASYSNVTDYLITPQFDLTSINSPVLSFDVAYAKRTPASKDSLFVEASLDCGLTWIRIYSKGGTSLITTNTFYLQQTFVPAAWQWRNEVISLGWLAQQQVQFRFVNYNAQGNDIYIDNINIDVPAAVNENNVAEVLVHPNPVTSESLIKLDALTLNDNYVTVSIYDVLGREMMTHIVAKTEIFPINKKYFAKGIYTIKVFGKSKLLGLGKMIVE